MKDNEEVIVDLSEDGLAIYLNINGEMFAECKIGDCEWEAEIKYKHHESKIKYRWMQHASIKHGLRYLGRST